MILDWDPPVDNGMPITKYKVFIRQSDLTYIVDTTVCDGGGYEQILSTQCAVLLDRLAAEPYNIQLGYSIYIKVVATNAYGDSQISPPGNGAIMVHEPDAPILVLNMVGTTSDSVIGISWSNGPSNGDSPILGYRITYDQSTGNWAVLATDVSDMFYVTTAPLQKGQTYKFKIQARNIVGYSEYSEEISIICAQAPD